ncbi:MAG: LLM class flavin-dependent oxidoreductase [Gammaproteobacteria bacterium]|nr:LLM class flavin-dependent oxidoreductase [Gammaproteobacteria bacterium]
MTISAGLGIANFSFDDAAGFWQWVDLCDSGGVDSIWQSDRIISKDDNLECMSVMAALAGATKNIKFGMNVASLGLRDPVVTAKACATIDVLSGGRLLPAFGVGSAISRDYVATGTPTKGRGKRTAEGLEILSRLWSEETVTMEGTYYQLNEASIAPRPIQNPMPLWVGGSAKQAIERTARWGTGWQAGIDSADQVGPIIEAIKARTEQLGRQIDEDHYGAGFGFRFGGSDEPIVQKYNNLLTKRLGRDPEGFTAVGGTEEIMRLLADFRKAGVHKFILRPIAAGTADMMTQTERLLEEVLPEVRALNQ